MNDGEDWSAYLSSEHTPCPTCGAVAVRPVGLPEHIHTFPPGHEVERDRAGFVVRDRCPGANP